MLRNTGELLGSLVIVSNEYLQACTPDEKVCIKHDKIQILEAKIQPLKRKDALNKYKLLCDNVLIQLQQAKFPLSFYFGILKPHLEFLAEIFQKHEDNQEASQHYYQLADLCDPEVREKATTPFKPYPNWDLLKTISAREKLKKQTPTKTVLGFMQAELKADKPAVLPNKPTKSAAPAKALEAPKPTQNLMFSSKPSSDAGTVLSLMKMSR